MNRKTIAVWCLYDFANSIYVATIPIVWAPYYANMIVGNETGLGDLWWTRVVSLTMLFVALTSPMVGAIADYAGLRKRLLIAYTLVSVCATALLATVEPGMLAFGFVLSLISYIGFEGGIVFYNAYLPEIAPRHYQGRVSGWGFAVGYAGSLAALLMMLPLVRGERYSLGFVAVAAGFLLFALPGFVGLPPDRRRTRGIREAALGGVRDTARTLREVLRIPQLRGFLLAYLFYEDGVITVINTASLFAAKTLGFEFAELLGLFAIVQISALVGAWIWAKPTDRLGPKFVVMAMLAQWSIVVTLAYFVQTKMQFLFLGALAGTGLGAVQAASRAFMASLIPRGKEGEYFGFYALCGKSAAILGPFLFGVVSRQTGGNQRIAILSVLVLYVLGASLLMRVRAGGPARVAEAGPAESWPRPMAASDRGS